MSENISDKLFDLRSCIARTMNGLKFKNCNHTVCLPSFNKPHESLSMQPLQPSNSNQLSESQSEKENASKSNSSVPKICPKMKIESQTEFETNFERSKYLLESGLMSDVVFVFYDEETKKHEKINCHKLILATRSRVFFKLFNEPNSAKQIEIKIIDVKAKDFKNLLRYIYYDETNVDIQSFTSTLIAAQKYALNTFTKALIEKVKFFNGDETCIMLKQLENHKINNTNFQRELIKKIEMETKSIIESNGFLNLNTETLKELLSNPILNIDEIEIFNAILKWAKNICKIQNVPVDSPNLKRILSSLIYLLTYKSMDLEQYANGPAKFKLLNDNDSVDLFLYFNLKDDSIEWPKSLIQSKRKSPTVYNVEFIDKNLESRRTRKGLECINFKTNEEIYLKGVIIDYNQIYSFRFDDAQVKIELSKRKIKNNDENDPISIKTIKLSSQNSEENESYMDEYSDDRPLKEISLKFDYPILIEPNVDYTISLWSGKGRYLKYKSCFKKASSANVSFEFESEDGINLMSKLIFNKFHGLGSDY